VNGSTSKGNKRNKRLALRKRPEKYQEHYAQVLSAFPEVHYPYYKASFNDLVVVSSHYLRTQALTSSWISPWLIYVSTQDGKAWTKGQYYVSFDRVRVNNVLNGDEDPCSRSAATILDQQNSDHNIVSSTYLLDTIHCLSKNQQRVGSLLEKDHVVLVLLVPKRELHLPLSWLTHPGFVDIYELDIVHKLPQGRHFNFFLESPNFKSEHGEHYVLETCRDVAECPNPAPAQVEKAEIEDMLLDLKWKPK
jgi:hypothetical protein